MMKNSLSRIWRATARPLLAYFRATQTLLSKFCVSLFSFVKRNTAAQQLYAGRYIKHSTILGPLSASPIDFHTRWLAFFARSLAPTATAAADAASSTHDLASERHLHKGPLESLDQWARHHPLNCCTSLWAMSARNSRQNSPAVFSFLSFLPLWRKDDGIHYLFCVSKLFTIVLYSQYLYLCVGAQFSHSAWAFDCDLFACYLCFYAGPISACSSHFGETIGETNDLRTCGQLRAEQSNNRLFHSLVLGPFTVPHPSVQQITSNSSSSSQSTCTIYLLFVHLLQQATAATAASTTVPKRH